ncbi:hypothetical protein GGR56DRAFT_278248 [Xylariaceae sp. FL0804]|nr:hypothetical protein GGR56DRAFT_278248 [Xylariaceae sp. FL0804]
MAFNIFELPDHMILNIIDQIGDPEDLMNFLLTDKRFAILFQTYRQGVLNGLYNQAAPDCLDLAMCVIHCPLYNSSAKRSTAEFTQEVTAFARSKLRAWPPPPPQRLKSVGEYRRLCGLMRRVDMCIHDWVTRVRSWDISNPEQACLGPGAWPQLRATAVNDLPRPDVSTDELLRFRKAFLAYELYCRLRYQAPLVAGAPEEIRDMFLQWLKVPWKVEQISCVASYVAMAYRGTLQRLWQRFMDAHGNSLAEGQQLLEEGEAWRPMLDFLGYSLGYWSPDSSHAMDYLNDDPGRRNMSNQEIVSYGFASLGLDFLVDYCLGTDDEQEKQVKHQGGLLNNRRLTHGSFYDDMDDHFCKRWVPLTFKELEKRDANVFKDGRETPTMAWFRWNQDLLDARKQRNEARQRRIEAREQKNEDEDEEENEDDDEEENEDDDEMENEDDEEVPIRFRSELKARAWVFWDRPSKENIFAGFEESFDIDQDFGNFMAVLADDEAVTHRGPFHRGGHILDVRRIELLVYLSSPMREPTITRREPRGPWRTHRQWRAYA